MTSEIRFDRDDETKRVVMTVTGTVAVENWAASVADLIARGMWSYSIVYDLRQANARPLLERLASLAPIAAELITERGQRGPIAVLVPPQDLQAWRTALRAHFTGVVQISAFSDEHPAIVWLDERTWRPALVSKKRE